MDNRPGTLEGVVMNSTFWRNKRVFLTGHTGFKGGWLSLWLQQLGAVGGGVVDMLRDDVTRFEKRLDLLAARR